MKRIDAFEWGAMLTVPALLIIGLLNLASGTTYANLTLGVGALGYVWLTLEIWKDRKAKDRGEI